MSVLTPLLAFGFLLLSAVAVFGETAPASRPSPAGPEIEGHWVRPAKTTPAEPIWGHADGLRVGLSPLPGPRGLLRVYAPYLDLPPKRAINYIAVEPILAGRAQRGFSELERSKLDSAAGLRFWSVDDPTDPAPRDPATPARGRILAGDDSVESLVVYVMAERYGSGAHVYVRLTFRADRPHEVGLATFAHDDSPVLQHCILTATMGNYARLRQLELADGRIAKSTELWPDYRGEKFTPHARFPLAQLVRTAEGHAVARASTDEANPQQATYAEGTRPHWRYTGKTATQAWRCESPPDALEVLVNGRFMYWNSRAPIPGGVAFENIEMLTPFRQGAEFWFSVTPAAAADHR